MRSPLPQTRFEWLALLVFLAEVVILGYFASSRHCVAPAFCPDPDAKIRDLFLFLGIFFGIPATVYGVNWIIYKVFRTSKTQQPEFKGEEE